MTGVDGHGMCLHEANGFCSRKWFVMVKWCDDKPTC